MKPRALELLGCPYCRDRLECKVHQRDGDEIVEATLTCPACGRAYPIAQGIPQLLPDELAPESVRTAKGFGYEWTRFTEIRPEYEEQFLDWVAPVSKDFFPGKLVLDAGCGKGRHAQLASRFGAKDVVALDLSEAVFAAEANTRSLPNVHVVRGDIYHPPVRRKFDYVYSIGVLHHLPDPARGFAVLKELLADGGAISVWVYGREGNDWIVRFVDPIRTAITSRLPHSLLYFGSLLPTAALQLSLKLAYRPVQTSSSLRRLRRFLPYSSYLFSIAPFTFRENHSIVFDHLVAPIAFYLRREEIEQWFDGDSFAEVTVSQRNENSWRGFGRSGSPSRVR